MPINIYNSITKERIAYLCEKSWVLIDLFDYFEQWINDHSALFNKSQSYIADIGFSANYSAMSGGPAFNIELMKKLIDINVNVYISEYPPHEQ